MSITVACRCNKRLAIPDRLAGRQVLCRCGRRLLVPSASPPPLPALVLVSAPARPARPAPMPKPASLRPWLWGGLGSLAVVAVLAMVAELLVGTPPQHAPSPTPLPVPPVVVAAATVAPASAPPRGLGRLVVMGDTTYKLTAARVGRVQVLRSELQHGASGRPLAAGWRTVEHPEPVLKLVLWVSNDSPVARPWQPPSRSTELQLADEQGNVLATALNGERLVERPTQTSVGPGQWAVDVLTFSPARLGQGQALVLTFPAAAAHLNTPVCLRLAQAEVAR